MNDAIGEIRGAQIRWNIARSVGGGCGPDAGFGTHRIAGRLTLVVDTLVIQSGTAGAAAGAAAAGAAASAAGVAASAAGSVGRRVLRPATSKT